jgi:F0F1-type ATP synthase assembly protein I
MGAESEATSDVRAASPRADLQLTQSSGSYELVLGAVVFGLIGLLIDRRIGTTPVFLLIFTIAGLAGASISLYYRYKYRIAQIQAETAALKSAGTVNRP